MYVDCLRLLRFYAYNCILAQAYSSQPRAPSAAKPPATTGLSQSTNLAVLRAPSPLETPSHWLEPSAALHAVSFFTRHQSLARRAA